MHKNAQRILKAAPVEFGCALSVGLCQPWGVKRRVVSVIVLKRECILVGKDASSAYLTFQRLSTLADPQ